MANIKLTYFDLRAKGETARLLLAYSGLEWEDERIMLPSHDPIVWNRMKPSMPWGQLPSLTYKGEKICQSMAICRFLAREAGIAGRNSLESAMVDEIVDVIQDTIEANYKAFYLPNRREHLVNLTGQTFPTTLTQLEKRLTERGGQFFVGNNFTWADLHTFFLCSEDFICPTVLANYPKLSNLVSRVGEMPNIKRWLKTRPKNPAIKNLLHLIYFKNAYKLLAKNSV